MVIVEDESEERAEDEDEPVISYCARFELQGRV